MCPEETTFLFGVCSRVENCRRRNFKDSCRISMSTLFWKSETIQDIHTKDKAGSLSYASFFQLPNTPELQSLFGDWITATCVTHQVTALPHPESPMLTVPGGCWCWRLQAAMSSSCPAGGIQEMWNYWNYSTTCTAALLLHSWGFPKGSREVNINTSNCHQCPALKHLPDRKLPGRECGGLKSPLVINR